MYIKNAILNLKRNKNYLFEIILVFIFTVTFLLSNISIMINISIYNINHKGLSRRTIIVKNLLSTIDVEDLYSIKHVNMVYGSIDHILYTNEKLGSIEISPIDNKEYNNLDIVNGTKKLNRFDLICPEKLIATTDTSDIEYVKSHTYETKKLLNKVYNEHLVRSTTELINNRIVDTVLAEKDIEYKIVGTYDNKKYMTPNSQCFASKDTVDYIIEFMYVDYDLQQNSNKNIIVDKVENVPYVKKELKEKGFSVSNSFEFNKSFILLVEFLSIVLLIIIIASITLLINFIIKRDLINKKIEILILRSIGYDKNKINEIYLFEYLTRVFIALILSLVLSITIYSLIKMKYDLLFTYENMSLTINPISYIILFLLGFIYPCIVIKGKIRNILC